MAIKKTNTKKATTKKATKEEAWFEDSINQVTLRGVVKRVFFETEKVIKLTLETVEKTVNEKWAHAFIPVTIFTLDQELDIVEGTELSLEGRVATSSYNGKYSTDIMTDADHVDIETPFN